MAAGQTLEIDIYADRSERDCTSFDHCTSLTHHKMHFIQNYETMPRGSFLRAANLKEIQD